MASWYYAENGQRMGPVDEAAMSGLVGSGRVGLDTLVWTEGMADWAAARSALPPELMPQAPSAPPAFSQPQPPFAGGSGAGWQGGAASDHPQGMSESVKAVFRKYATFSGRARRGEYWWFVLFNLIVGLVLVAIDLVVLGTEVMPLSRLFQLAVLIPSLAVAARRLHDTGRSGWWLLLALVPLIGPIVLIVWLATRGNDGPNQFGPA